MLYLFDHIAVGVADLEASVEFFLEALAPLRLQIMRRENHAVGLGRRSFVQLWLYQAPIPHRLRLAFTADSHSQVDEFFLRAIAAGATSDRVPSVREHRQRECYTASVVCPHGHVVEMVCRSFTSGSIA